MPNLNHAIALFFLLNSFGTLPLFLALTKKMQFKERIQTALIANGTAIALLTLFIWLGNRFLTFFGLSLSAFEIGGGIILFKIGLEMINCTLSIEGYLDEATQINNQDSGAVVPLGVPLLAGPGSIAVVMTMTVTQATEAGGATSLTSSLLLASVGSFVVWTLGGYIFLKYKGNMIRDLLSKLGGLFLLILAVQMIINGVLTLMG